jgi:hypothetical protein
MRTTYYDATDEHIRELIADRARCSKGAPLDEPISKADLRDAARREVADAGSPEAWVDGGCGLVYYDDIFELYERAGLKPVRYTASQIWNVYRSNAIRALRWLQCCG